MNDKIKLIINLDRGGLMVTALLTKKGEGIDFDKLMDVLNRIKVIDTANVPAVEKMLNDGKFVALMSLFALETLAKKNGLG